MNLRKPMIALGLLLFLAACTRASPTSPDAKAAVEVTKRPEYDAGTEPFPTIVTNIAPVNAASTGCANPVPAERRFPLPPWPSTNFCRHSVPYEEFRSGGVGRDTIPAIDAPKFETIDQGNLWLLDEEPVLALALDEDARAYPIAVLIWHEIVNDVVEDRPVVVTYCPLCNSGLAFERRLGDRVLDFGVSGLLRNADLVMYDRQTESWWQQFTGEAIVGELTGAQLGFLPVSLVSWGDFKAQFPNGRVLSADTGFERFYGENPYPNYDALSNQSTRFYDGKADDRLPAKMRVMGLKLGETAVAYPYDVLETEQVVNDSRGGKRLVVFWKKGTLSPLYNVVIADSRDVGNAAVFSREVAGQTLTFAAGDIGFRDLETGSLWNIFGTGLEGPLAGRQLERLPAHEFFWFAWAAFEPDTEIYPLSE